MSNFLSTLATGVLSNLISDGIGAGAKRILSKRDIDFELRKAIDGIRDHQANIEGMIEKIVNNQNLLLNLFNNIIENYQLQSRVYIENENLIVISHNEDINVLDAQRASIQETTPNQVHGKDKFENYRKYVAEKRAN